MLRWAWFFGAILQIAAAFIGSSITDCANGCRVIKGDGADAAAPPQFLQALLDPEVNQIVLNAPRYQLKPSAWATYGGNNLVVLNRNLTVRSTEKPYGVLDFQQLERKLLLDAGVTVKFNSIVLQNVRKLGGFALDFVVGTGGSQVLLDDVVRVRLACQLPQNVYQAARSFQRVSAQFPPNSVSLATQFCFTGALDAAYQKRDYCFNDALHFEHFSMQARNNDPDAGRQYPGYTLYQSNTTVVCLHTITQDCINEMGEEVCLAMLVSDASMNSRNPFVWTKGAVAGVAVAGGVVVVALLCFCYFRHHLLMWFVQLAGTGLHELEHGSSQHLPGDTFEGKGLEYGDSVSGYTGRRAISQQVTLGVLLGAGSFGRVYKGRWHSSNVAIKIMSCTRAELPKVLREAEVMMQLNHANIVRAFHASVWNPAEQMRALQAREARTSTSSATKTRLSVERSSSWLGPGAPSAAAAASTATARSTVSHPTSGLEHGSCGNDYATVKDAAVVSLEASIQQGESVVEGLSDLSEVHGPTDEIAGAHSSTPSKACMQVQQSGQMAAVSFLTASGPLVTDDHKQLSSWGSSVAAVPVFSTPGEGTGGVGNKQVSSAAVRAGCSNSGNVVAAFGDGSFISSGYGTTESSAHHMVDAASQPLSVSSGMYSTGPASGGASHVVEADTSAHCAAATCSAGSNAQGISDGCNGLAAAGPLVNARQPAAHEPKPQGSFRQHLIGRLVRNSSGGSSQQTSTDSAAAAAPGAGAASATGAKAAAAATAAEESNPVHSSDSYQQASSGGRTAKQQQLQAGQQPQQGHQTGDTHCAEVQVWIVLELCSGGTLKDAVVNGRMMVDDNAGLKRVLQWLLETANGMAYLHSKGVLHGDLKAGNVLLQNAHGPAGQVAKISDFGLAAVLMDGATHRSTASMGTITHMAPELLRSGHMSPAADVYSYGIMMWEVFTKKQAYQGLHYGAVVEHVVIQKDRPPVPDDMPEEYGLLMCACWDAEPSNRPSFVQIVKCLEIMLANFAAEQSGAIDGGAECLKDGAGGGAGQFAMHAGSNVTGSSAAAGPAWGDVQLQPWQQQLAPAGEAQLKFNASGSSDLPQYQNRFHTPGQQPNVLTSPQQGHQVRVLVGSAGDGTPGDTSLGGGQPTQGTVSTQSYTGPSSQQLGSGSNVLDENPYLGDF